MREKFYFLASFLLLVVPLASQAPPTAQRQIPGISVWVGASIFTFNPDYGCTSNSPFSCGASQIIGVGPFVDTSPFIFHRIGLEGEARLGLFHGPDDLIENSYLGGPRLRIFHYKDLDFNAKFLVGLGQLDVPDHLLGQGNYFAFAPGGSVDNRITKYVSVRVEYEYQRWPSFQCYKCTDGAIGGLTPNGFSFGVSYQLHSSSSQTAPH